MGGHSAGSSTLFGERQQLHRDKSGKRGTGGILQAHNLGQRDSEANSAFDAWEIRGRQDFSVGPKKQYDVNPMKFLLVYTNFEIISYFEEKSCKVTLSLSTFLL